MNFNWLNQLGDWNPQLLRELKGRGKLRNILVATAISVVGQFVLMLGALGQLPNNQDFVRNYSHRYCTGESKYGVSQCLLDQFGNIAVNWQLWSLDIFKALSIAACFVLLVGGTYLLINDLANEERRATLNFIRLSPQSTQSILSGKMLGVPSLAYLVVFLAIPLHLWLGFGAKLSVIEISSFYLMLVAACVLYYSGALLFGLVGSWLGGFQAWLGSGIVLGFLLLTQQDITGGSINQYPVIVLWMLNPSSFIYSLSPVNFQWFILPLGEHLLTRIGFNLLVYGMGAYFIWQSLQRCFRDPNATIFSKQQSYLFTTWFTLSTVGLADWQKLLVKDNSSYNLLAENVLLLLLLDFGLALLLIAALSPHRQTMLDWARYRKMQTSSGQGYKSLVEDLIWGEKSPSLLAIAINCIIVCAVTSTLIFLSHQDFNQKISGFLASVLASSIVMLYAAVAQLSLLSKNQHRIYWAIGIVSVLIVVPTIIGSMFYDNSLLWIFSVAAPVFAIAPDERSYSHLTSCLAILGYLSVVGLLGFQLTKKLQKAGESATKALLAEA